ncbi:hypothetical protein G9A89_015085 [Geosiphon pyriformis]|nr:hypothetical protein G9A89_015085 [Geosiphon pyriformis]
MCRFPRSESSLKKSELFSYDSSSNLENSERNDDITQESLFQNSISDLKVSEKQPTLNEPALREQSLDQSKTIQTNSIIEMTHLFNRIRVVNQKLLTDFRRFAVHANSAYCHAFVDEANYEIVIYLRGDDHQRISYLLFPSWSKYLPVTDATVHREMYLQVSQGVELMMKKIDDLLVKYFASNFKICFVGHALGGAYALLAGLNYLENRVDHRVKIYSFGAPRVGDSIFADYVSNQMKTGRLDVYRITHTNDPYVHFPTFWWPFLFMHSEEEYWIGFDGMIYQCPKEMGHESQSCSNSAASQRYNIIPSVNAMYGPYFGITMRTSYALITGLLWKYEQNKVMQKNLWPEIGLDKILSRILTFGAPKIGNNRFSVLIDQIAIHLRVTHGNDHVSHFPDDSMKWKHSGAEIWLQPSGNCDCPENPYFYWDCNNLLNPEELKYETNMECNAGQSITKVSDNLFHNGPYFGVIMGDCKGL